MFQYRSHVRCDFKFMDIRHKKENLIVLGILPAFDKEQFFDPFVQELDLL